MRQAGHRVHWGLFGLPGDFDDQALCSADARVAELRRSARESVVSPDWFSFVELCETQSQLNHSAATSPLDPIPMGLVGQASEIWRVCLLGMVNASYGWQLLPTHWAVVPVAPVPKPGKEPTAFDAYRQISLLTSGLKVYDKLLQLRVAGRTYRLMRPWQGGVLWGRMTWRGCWRRFCGSEGRAENVLGWHSLMGKMRSAEIRPAQC